jgi:hypothetical protein
MKKRDEKGLKKRAETDQAVLRSQVEEVKRAHVVFERLHHLGEIIVKSGLWRPAVGMLTRRTRTEVKR